VTARMQKRTKRKGIVVHSCFADFVVREGRLRFLLGAWGAQELCRWIGLTAEVTNPAPMVLLVQATWVGSLCGVFVSSSACLLGTENIHMCVYTYISYYI
jgi:hypothetical protein